MSSYVTTYKGKPIYAVTREEYIKFSPEKRNNSNVYFVITDAKYVMFHMGIMVGVMMADFKRFRPISNGKSWQDVLGYHPKPVVITERPSVESTTKETAEKLKKMAAEGEQRLQAMVAQGESLVRRPHVPMKKKKKSISQG